MIISTFNCSQTRKEMKKEDWEEWANHYTADHAGVREVWSHLSPIIAALSRERPAILDMCCGPGFLVREMHKQRPNANIEGLDYSKRMIERARNICPSAEFHIEDVRNMTLSDSRYDLVIWSGGMPYFNKSETIKALKKAKNGLKNGGTLLLTTLFGINDSSSEIITRGDLHIYRLQEACSILEGAGFDVQKSIVIKQSSTPTRVDQVLLIEAKSSI